MKVEQSRLGPKNRAMFAKNKGQVESIKSRSKVKSLWVEGRAESTLSKNQDELAQCKGQVSWLRKKNRNKLAQVQSRVELVQTKLTRAECGVKLTGYEG